MYLRTNSKNIAKVLHMPNSFSEEVSIFEDGCEELFVIEELVEKLEKYKKLKKPMRIKMGLDPTSPDLHLGHTVVLVKLRQLQDLGHKVILLIGDFTAMIGDPTGRNVTRPSLSNEEIINNSQTYFSQAGSILNMTETEVRYNSEWCSALGAEGLIKLASKITVARMLERDDFTKRYKGGVAIALHEFLYPLVQGYDSVILKSDLEIGGTDQKFNLLMGRELQKNFGQNPQCIITMPLLEGLDGVEKMSKTKNNFVALTDSPEDIYGKLMSISDDLMWRYITLLSLKGKSWIEEKKANVSGGYNPKNVKSEFAFEIVDRFHGRNAAHRALGEFERRFAQNEVPENLTEKVFTGSQFDVIFLLKNSGLVPSTSEGFRMIKQGAVRINQEKVIDMNAKLKRGSYIVQVGKRKIIKIIIE